MEISQIAEVQLQDINLLQRDRSQQDQSLSYCNGVIKKSFQPEFFKLGDPTPGQANDCSGTHFIVDNRLDLDKGCLGAGIFTKVARDCACENQEAEEMCSAGFSSPAVLHSKNYEDYQNDVSMQENDGHCNAELVDGDFAQVESNLIVR